MILPDLIRHVAGICLAAASFSIAGCKEPEPPADENPSEKPAAARPAPRAPDLTGLWTVVTHHMPGISALSNDEAKARYGETVRLTATEAFSAGERCDAPTYATRAVRAEEYLATEFKVPPGGLAPLASHDEVYLMEVSCGGEPWTGFGGLLLTIDVNRALSPWEGVFFELARDHDFRAIGQEPGWQLEIRKGIEMRFTYDYGEGVAVTPVPAAQTDLASNAETFHAVTEANDLRVTIEPKACQDTMSGKPFAATVAVAHNGREFRGCGETVVRSDRP